MSKYLHILEKHLPAAASVAVAIVPILVLVLWFDVPRKIIGQGAMAYAVGAVGVKLPLYHLLVTRVLHGRLSNMRLAVAQGALSALAELGAALGFFLLAVPVLTPAELVGFGIAAGSIEAVILPFMNNPLQGTPLEEHAEETSRSASGNTAVQWLGVLERVLASVVHTSSRGLTYLSAATGNPIPMALATAGFASIDGRAYFAHLERWRFDDAGVLAGFYRFLGAVACILTALFVLLYAWVM